MDEMDVRILEALQRGARYSYSALSRLVHLSTPSVANRARKLEEAGVITSYRAPINPRTSLFAGENTRIAQLVRHSAI